MQTKVTPDIVQKHQICEMREGSTVIDAAKYMEERNVAAVLVTDDDCNLTGIFTERDLTRRVVAAGRDPAGITLGEVMTRNPDTLSPSDTVLNALELMQSRSCRHLPVVDAGGGVIGMVSVRDLYAIVKDEMERTLRETEAFVFGDRYGA